jgi:HD-like signal output (HDOD) protein
VRNHSSTPTLPVPTGARGRYSDSEIRRRVDACPKLASLQSVNQALSRLAKSDMSLTSQIAEIISRDPSLSQRLLRMVNSVYFGLSAHINNIEEAVFFLGLRQIREFSVATPVIEEMEQLQSFAPAPLRWKNLWSHSIGTAILTREILSSTQNVIDDDTDYLVGLLHNVGKIVMAYAFPEELAKVASTPVETPADVCALEREVIGWDHAHIGAYFLERHQLVEELSFSVRYHHDPKSAPKHQTFAAAVQVADYLVRHVNIECGFEKVDPIPAEAWTQLDGWKILYGSDDHAVRLARASLANALARLPSILNGLL